MRKVIPFLLAAVLTASAGRIQFQGHSETYYNLNMRKVIQRTNEAFGLGDHYWIREDGVKMYGPWVIVAAHPTVTRYSLVETSRGTGIVLDTHTSEDKGLIDLAVTW